MEKIVLATSQIENIAEILEPENKNIWAWIGKAKKMGLSDYALGILPKLRIHEENEMEGLWLSAEEPEYIAEILEMENNSISLGKVKILELCSHAVETLPKLKFHGEYVMERLGLEALFSEHTAEIPKIENNSIWIGKMKRLELHFYAIEILPKFRIHRENVMEELVLNADSPEHITKILEAKDKSIWIGRVRKVSPIEHAKRIKGKLDFTLITPDDQEENGGD
ncbi:MAG: uncharacterized protein A8A55_2421 [Amphiamblys sp. WSBS2006]|nr:MAG: uncharacterized protein A8A55_2421 [Amphiamblys sp. WSBS2006]